MEIRSIVVNSIDSIHSEECCDAGGNLRKIAIAAIVRNPYAHLGFVQDLSELIEASASVGTTLGRLAVEYMGDNIESYGKASIVGYAGEQEHGNAGLTSTFGDAVRKEIGGGEAWISSTGKIGGPGTTIDVPLAFKDEVWIRSHYDTVQLTTSDGPLPDELALILAVANRGRIHARVGGKTKQEHLESKDAN